MSPVPRRSKVRRQAAANPLQIDLQSRLQRLPVSRANIAKWARVACGSRGKGAVVAVKIVGATEGKRLNLLWRGRDYPTNVLSFPAASLPVEPRPLGDLVLCAPVIEREARAQCKPLAAHWAHLIVHGCLHLLGHDHERDDEALVMERRERRLLAEFGIADPYRPSVTRDNATRAGATRAGATRAAKTLETR